MKNKSGLSDDEKQLFQEAMRGVKPHVAKIKITPPTKPSTRIKKKIIPDQDPLSDHENLPTLQSEDLIEFSRPGLQHKTLRKLRSGQYNVEAILDLHGMTVMIAKQALSAFMRGCREKGVSHALIIHGKGRATGQPILKNKLNHWLRQLEDVLAFCSATAKQGRAGAMYVLLKNTKGRQI